MTLKQENIYCPLCKQSESSFISKQSDIELFTTPNSYSYLKCNGCDCIYIHPMPIDQLDKIYPQDYYSGLEEQTGLLAKVKGLLDTRLFKNILNKLPGKQLSILDIGGGSGWLLNKVKKLDSRVKKTSIVDINQSAQPSAEQNGHQFYCNRIEELNISKKFDFILMLNLIEHIETPELVLKKVNSLLKANGLLLIKTPNTLTIDRLLFQKYYWGGFHCPRHWILFNKNNLIQLAKKQGFVVQSFKYTQGSPQWAASILGTLAKKNWIKLSPDRPMPKHPLLIPLLAIFAAFDFARSLFFPTAQMFCLLRKI